MRGWLGLNSYTTCVHHSRREGDLGVPDSHLLNMLNNDDSTIREIARASLFLEFGKRKVPIARESEPSFLGFHKKANWTLLLPVLGLDLTGLISTISVTGLVLTCSRLESIPHVTPHEIMIKDKNITGRRSAPPGNSHASLLSIKH